MPGINAGMEIAKRAMMAHQATINVLGHNIANVNTTGYTRQRALLETSTPLNVMPGALGTGVDMVEIERIRNTFADRQYRQEKGAWGRMDTSSSVLSQVEGIFGEPSDSGVAALINNFFAAYSDLSNNPSDRGSRVAVQTAGKALAEGIRRLDARLADYRTTLNDEVSLQVGEVNRIAGEIGELNGQIATSTNTGLNPNDLMDRRDALVDQLAEIAGVTAIQQADGTVSVRLGGKSIVDQTTVTRLQVALRGQNDPAGSPVLYADGSAANFPSGRIAALVEMRDTTIQSMRDNLGELAGSLIGEVNALHRQGSGGVDFFAGTDASTIELSAAVASDAQAIATSTTGLAGDNDLALAIAGLKDSNVMASGTTTLGGFFAGLVTALGAAKSSASEGADNQALAVQQVDDQRSAASGVNLDEETAALMLSQRAYEAAARFLTVLNGLAETVLTELGS
jgi:flagellar hook-associated protein 1